MRKQKQKNKNILPGLLALGTGIFWMARWLKKQSLLKEQRLQGEEAMLKEQAIQRERRILKEQGIPMDSAVAQARVARAGGQIAITGLESAEKREGTPDGEPERTMLDGEEGWFDTQLPKR